MVILGGLEVVVGGYLIHRYHKDKNEKKRLIEEAEQARQRRHNTYPGPQPPSYPQQQPPPQKFACYNQYPQPQSPQYHQPRPHTAQTFPQNGYYAPQPRPHVQPQAQPPYPQMIRPIRRQDSFATISNMPVANGSPPLEAVPQLPPRRPHPSTLSVPQGRPPNHPYGNMAFSASTPALPPHTGAPYTNTSSPLFGRNTIDDNWETHGHQPAYAHSVMSESTHLGEPEDDPPPPYRP